MHHLQILMSVNWGCIHVTPGPVPTAVTQSEASTVHASMALREMDSTAQVRINCYLRMLHIFFFYSGVA